MPHLAPEAPGAEQRMLRTERTAYNATAEAERLQENMNMLNVDQRVAFDLIEAALYGQQARVHCNDSAWHSVLHTEREQHDSVVNAHAGGCILC